MIKRSATLADLPQLTDLEALCNPYPWSIRQLQQSLEHDDVSVIEDDGQIVAMLISKSVCEEAEIYLVNTAFKYRRQGLAKQLIADLQNNNQRIFLEVRASNLNAQHVYASLGFKQIAVRRAYYNSDEGREDALIWEWSC